MEQNEVEVNKNGKKEQGQYPTLLTEEVSTLKDRLYGQEAEEEKLPLRNKSGKSQKTGNRIRFFLPFRGLSHLSHLINMRVELCFKTPSNCLFLFLWS